VGEPGLDRAAWLQSLRRLNKEQENALAPVFDARWGDIEPTHRAFVDRFLAMLPPGGRVLDAACGTGKYFPMVLAGGRSLLGVDHAGAYLAKAAEKFPDVPTEELDLQGLEFTEEFHGVMCVDAMEFVPPEDWPGILERFHRALHRGGWLYLTVELHPDEVLRAGYEDAQRAGFPVVEREIIWKEPDGDLYHYYPRIAEVRAWLRGAGFEIEKEAEGPWDDGQYAYHHVLARRRTPN
jgi:cyclopropane fatty-acyl-phospholipid synthase-like methyltransferase